MRCHRIALTYSQYAAYLDLWLFQKESYWFRQYKAEPTSDLKRHTNANWFHFSTWAALTVSRNIGSIAAPQRFDGLPNVVRQTIAPYVVRARGTDQRVSQALAGAQLRIFVNTCLAFMEKLKFCDESDVKAEGLKSDEGMLSLARVSGLSCKWKSGACLASGPLRERYILLANILSTVVEQRLINAYLANVIDAVPNRLTEAAEGHIGQTVEHLLGVTRQVTELTLAGRLEPVRAAGKTIWSRLLTDQVFVMSLPGEMLRVGRDIPPLKRNEPYYPKNLRHPQEFTKVDASEFKEIKDAEKAASDMALLCNLLARFDRTIGDGRGSAARDWRRYDERMNWAVTLLRSRQQDSTIFWPPYSQEDEELIFSGQLPKRSGDATQVVAPLDNELVCKPDISPPDDGTGSVVPESPREVP